MEEAAIQDFAVSKMSLKVLGHEKNEPARFAAGNMTQAGQIKGAALINKRGPKGVYKKELPDCLQIGVTKLSSDNITTQEIVAALESGGFKPKSHGDGWESKCPVHGGKSNSLKINDADDGKALLHCFGSECTYEDVLRALGLWNTNGARRRIVTTYDYDGFYETVRYEPKGFAQRHKTDSGEYAWNLKGVTPRLYRQDDLMAAKPSQVFIVEGEKDVETLRGVEVLAVTNHGGAKKWRKAHTAALKKAGVKTVVVLPDDDEPGREHANKVAESCKAAGLGVKVVELPDKNKDVSAYLNGDGDKAGLLQLAATAQDWTAPAKAEAVLEKSKTTFKKKDAKALEGALAELGIEIRYNQRSMRCEYKTGAAKWVKSTDRKQADLRQDIAEGFSYNTQRGIMALRYGKDSWDECLNALLYHRERDPFRDWLEALPKWDGTGRLAKLLVNLLGAAEGKLTYWASFYLCLGPIQRTYEPGCPLREIPILIGPQGIGKSRLLRSLLPEDQPDWFSDSLCVSEPSQKRLEAILGRVICELSELTGFRRAELEALKAFISRCDDGATRLSYRRDPETALRRCVLVGTTNDDECLPNDPSGNSRFVTIKCGKGSHVEPYLDEHREQLWAEAMSYYHEAEWSANLPRRLMGLQADHAETHRRKDQVVEDAVAAITGDGPYTLRELFDLVYPHNTSGDRRTETRLADALKQADWTKKHERIAGGKRAYLWRRGD